MCVLQRCWGGGSCWLAPCAKCVCVSLHHIIVFGVAVHTPSMCVKRWVSGAGCVWLSVARGGAPYRILGKVKNVTWRKRLLLFDSVRGRRQAHNPTLAKIMRLASTRRMSHTSPPSPACNGLWRDNRRALVSTRLGSQAPRSRQVSMKRAGWSTLLRTHIRKPVIMGVP